MLHELSGLSLHTHTQQQEDVACGPIDMDRFPRGVNDDRQETDGQADQRQVHGDLECPAAMTAQQVGLGVTHPAAGPERTACRRSRRRHHRRTRAGRPLKAADENRTRVAALGGQCITTMLQPRCPHCDPDKSVPARRDSLQLADL